MDEKNKIDGSSRRKFIKIAAATAYVAPLILSMPAQATYRKSGSNPAPTRKRRFKRIKRRIHRKYRQYNRSRRW